AQPRRPRGGERRGERGLEAVERRLDRVEHALAVALRGECELERAGRRRAAQREADRAVGAAAAPVDERGEERPVLQRTGLGRRAVDLVEREAVAEERARLPELRGEARERELLLLVHGGVDAPGGGVAVPPLAPDRDAVARNAPLGEP